MGKGQPLKDLTGQRFGRWTVLQRDNSINKKNIYWQCKCDCGTIKSVAGTSLRAGLSVSCGCFKDEKTSTRNKTNVEDLTGQRFGHWTVISQDLSTNSKSKRGARWICRCDCGKEQSNLGYALRFGRTLSCGCQNVNQKLIDLTGKRYGKLVVLYRDIPHKEAQGAWWVCKCDCGNEITVPSGRLRSGVTQSCGCLVKNKTTRNKDDNLTGKTFNNWTVLYKDNSKSRTYYVCQCKCGTIKSITRQSIVEGRSKSCGCLNVMPDLVGQKFGKLFVVSKETNKETPGGAYWRCVCDCGSETVVSNNHLISGHTKSCGCLRKEVSSLLKQQDLTGKKYGRLTVLNLDHIDEKHQSYWQCKCDCGNIKVVGIGPLKNGDVRSCGCLQREASAERAVSRMVDLSGNRYGLLTVMDRVLNPHDSSRQIWRCICDCGNETVADGYYLRTGMVNSCGCKRQSKYELFVLQYFGEKSYIANIDYECQKKFSDLRGYGSGILSYDFSFYKNNELCALIECQGLQHYKPVDLFGGEEQFKVQKHHDELKKKYAESIGVKLIEIPYTASTYNDVKSILISEGI